MQQPLLGRIRVDRNPLRPNSISFHAEPISSYIADFNYDPSSIPEREEKADKEQKAQRTTIDGLEC